MSAAKVIDQLAVDLSTTCPDHKRFSRRNLRYLRRFAQLRPVPDARIGPRSGLS